MALQPVDTDTTTTDAETYKGQDIDSDGDGVVDKADDAELIRGQSPNNFSESGHTHSGQFINPDAVALDTKLTVPVYGSVSDVPSQPEGSVVYISGSGLHVEDGN